MMYQIKAESEKGKVTFIVAGSETTEAAIEAVYKHYEGENVPKELIVIASTKQLKKTEVLVV